MTTKPASKTLGDWDAEAASIPDDRIYRWLTNTRLPQDLVDLVYDLMDWTRVVEGRVLRVGKVAILKLIDLARARPYLGIGQRVGQERKPDVISWRAAVAATREGWGFLAEVVRTLLAK